MQFRIEGSFAQVGDDEVSSQLLNSSQISTEDSEKQIDAGERPAAKLQRHTQALQSLLTGNTSFLTMNVSRDILNLFEHSMLTHKPWIPDLQIAQENWVWHSR